MDKSTVFHLNSHHNFYLIRDPARCQRAATHGVLMEPPFTVKHGKGLVGLQ